MTKPRRPLDIYVRTSARGGRSDETLQTLDQQVRDCEQYAAREDLPLTGFVFEDRFRSGGAGKRAKRKALTQALARIRAGESGGIVVAYLSRATREGGVGLQLFEEIDRAGGAIYGPNVPADWKSADGRLVLGLQLIIDAHVVDKAREHTDKAKEDSIRRGVPTSATTAVGYKRGSDRRYVPDPEAAAVVREVFEMRVRGVGLTTLAAYLNASGVRTSHGNAWGLQAVHRLLHNRVYLGEARCGEWVNAMAHEPIVSPDLFQAAQVAPHRRKPRSDAQRFYLLSGLVRCAACGYAMSGSNRSEGNAIYRCPKMCGNGVCPNPARANARILEEEVVEAYLKDSMEVRLTSPDPGPREMLEHAVETTQRRLEQVLGHEARDALGSLWAADVKQRREEHEAALAALGAVTAHAGQAERLINLREAWREDLSKLGANAKQESDVVAFVSDEAKRELLSERFPVIMVRQTGRGKWEWFEPAEGKACGALLTPRTEAHIPWGPAT